MIQRYMVCLSLIAALLVPGILLAQQGTVRIEEGEKIYIIKKGDTLWHISERFLEDPFKWPVLWKHNTYIRNPHLIYPGDTVKITPEGIEIIARKERGLDYLPEGLQVEKLEAPVEAAPPVVEEVVEQPPLVTVKSPAGSGAGFVSKKEFEASGVILKSKENAILLGQGDVVFVAFAGGTEVTVGDRFAIYNVGEKVRHPVSGRKVGYLTEMLGIGEATSVDHTVEVRIETAYREIEKGAKLKPLEQFAGETVVKEPDVSVDGVVLATVEDKGGVAEKDMIYIDRGEGDGLEVGDIMYLYRDREKVKNPMASGKIVLPPVKLGKLILINVKESTSSAFIVQSFKAAKRGDIVSTEER
ncbi:MAG: LysM peptidoglycan-binding domain-containing protein [Deltaproteobacteria bacterium]|nr:LysM peptidoglycan-binding domain-containing protein [Deltaproteobacteria bacterium]